MLISGTPAPCRKSAYRGVRKAILQPLHMRAVLNKIFMLPFPGFRSFFGPPAWGKKRNKAADVQVIIAVRPAEKWPCRLMKHSQSDMPVSRCRVQIFYRTDDAACESVMLPNAVQIPTMPRNLYLVSTLLLSECTDIIVHMMSITFIVPIRYIIFRYEP